MALHHMNRSARDLAVEQSLDAAIEIDEVIRGEREDAPHLRALVLSLLGTNRDEGNAKRDLMQNSQFTRLYHRATSATDGEVGQDDLLNLLLAVDDIGVRQFENEQLAIVRRFCLGLNRELVSESYNRLPEPPLARLRNQKLSFQNGYSVQY
ncbi:hypothetical protein SAMN03159423_0471 [Bradyrhizobium sp. NFR13]|uniref:hypothetical protein n=1 Tax=Bradyrhizobium sp. NFR13 TaxID=1566285 RepID=UPI0008F00C04|nr:hypothetical protein [Bradyrhizobium sp. NFR13]SFM29571.1 hypothetical protein SAMN03159423_0471 [Bradyrhizobium sp. NFR13]